MENITQNFGNFSMLKEGVKYIYIYIFFNSVTNYLYIYCALSLFFAFVGHLTLINVHLSGLFKSFWSLAID